MHPELGRIAPDEVSNRVQNGERVKYYSRAQIQCACLAAGGWAAQPPFLFAGIRLFPYLK